MFGHSERWYPGLTEELQRAAYLRRDIPEEHWRYTFDLDETDHAVVALCVTLEPLPSILADRLSEHQANFYKKLQRNLNGIANVPDIFLAVIADFVEAVVLDQ